MEMVTADDRKDLAQRMKLSSLHSHSSQSSAIPASGHNWRHPLGGGWRLAAPARRHSSSPLDRLGPLPHAGAAPPQPRVGEYQAATHQLPHAHAGSLDSRALGIAAPTHSVPAPPLSRACKIPPSLPPMSYPPIPRLRPPGARSASEEIPRAPCASMRGRGKGGARAGWRGG